MQDVGGCRAIMANADDGGKLALSYVKGSQRLKHDLVRIDDYIANPKSSGYRGIHFAYRYRGNSNSPFNGFRIEIQIRSALQHCWATTVEIAGSFTRQALKSSQGKEEWLRFFALAGSAIALIEKCKPVPGTPIVRKELTAELSRYADMLHVEEFLIGCATGLNSISQFPRGFSKFPRGFRPVYYLLVLDPESQSTRTSAYPKDALKQAFDDSVKAEERGLNAVVVTAKSISELKRAYPNYFMDSIAFVTVLNAFLGREGKLVKKTTLKTMIKKMKSGIKKVQSRTRR
jgi:hypothetical protein